jgi:hypothetical protein
LLAFEPLNARGALVFANSVPLPKARAVFRKAVEE